MSGKDQAIRERAYKLWEQEGQPEGQAEQHWQRARQLIEEEESMQANPEASSPGTAAKTRTGSGRGNSAARGAKAGKTEAGAPAAEAGDGKRTGKAGTRSRTDKANAG